MTRPTRRGVLATLGASMALAGCGYRPAAGDPVWRDALENGTTVAAGDALVTTTVLRDADFTPIGGRFTVFDATTATVRDEVEYDGPLQGVTGGDSCYFVSTTELGAVGADGGVRWTRPVPDSPSAIGAGAGKLALLQDDGAVIGYDGADGSRRWRETTGAVTRSTDADRTVAVDDRGVAVAVGGEESRIAAIEDGGERRWDRAGADRDGDVSGLTLGADVAVVSYDSWADVRDRATGDRLLWLGDGDLEATPAVVGDTAYVPQGGELVAFDLDSGDRRWLVDDLPSGRYSSVDTAPVADERGVYAGGLGGMHGIDPDGARRWFTDGVVSECWLFPSVVVAETATGFAGYQRRRD